MRDYDVVVAGGGAAGLMAAAAAARGGSRTLLLEKMEKPARKIRITGKGRCNITNIRLIEDFTEKIRANPDFAAPALNYFSNTDTLEFFEGQGLELIKERGGRVFPASGRAWDVAEALVSFAKESGAEIECFSKVKDIVITGNRVTGIIKQDRNGKSEKITARNIIVATGGASYPSTGSSGDGYLIAHSTGHKIVDIRPSLTPLIIGEKFLRLHGLLLKNISVSLIVDGEIVRSEFGEMEFIKETAAGAVILKMSRDAVDGIIDGREVSIALDLKPALSVEKIHARIERERMSAPPSANMKYLMEKLLPRQMIPIFLSACRIKPEDKLCSAGTVQIEIIVNTLKNFIVPVIDFCPFENAIVTAGGVDVNDIDPQTLQSKLIEGLYFAGEVIDIDADTGGYNLQMAFSTGRLAGELRK
ncbi:MAG: NAD(P)/FAD-dependent oxidoreductase [Rikenellaceae bacterium]|nr:NAD(P)/FAD-dependent oxidoreductase [Rikenellaceae bacterium]